LPLALPAKVAGLVQLQGIADLVDFQPGELKMHGLQLVVAFDRLVFSATFDATTKSPCAF
jgi:hypothetical protein